MTPFEEYAIDQEQRLPQEQITESLRLDGMSDAAFGTNPKRKDPAYLDGYFAELRSRFEQGEHLEIRWLSSAYLAGGFDAPDWFSGEF